MKKALISDPSFLRPSEIMISCGNPNHAASKRGWKAHCLMRDVVAMMTVDNLDNHARV